MKKMRMALFCALAMMGSSAFAGVIADEISIVMQIGATAGGDKIDTGWIDSSGKSVTVSAGGTVQFGAGLEWKPVAYPISVRATVNLHSDSESASNGSLKFERTPFELTGAYHIDDHVYVGGGMRFVNSIKYSEKVSGYSDSATFDPTTGLIAEVGYRFNKHFQVSARYVSEEYTANKATSFNEIRKGEKFDGSHGGIFAAFLF